jgi:hypothetical protein
MSSTLLLPPREQLCNRSCSNKTHTHSTCPPLSSSPHANIFVIGPAVIKHTLLHAPHTLQCTLPLALPFSSPSFFHTISLSPSSLVHDGQTSPHRPRLVVSRSTCPPIFPPHTRKQLCTRSCSNKHTHTQAHFTALKMGTPLVGVRMSARRRTGLR